MSTNMTLTEQLAHSTVRIECEYQTGGVGTGTGFFFKFAENGPNHIPAIVTNKHVIQGARKGKFVLTLASPDGKPDLKRHANCVFDNFQNMWLPHPSPKVDLCIMLVAPLLKQAEANKKPPPFFISLDHKLLPTEEELIDLSLVEDITMIGYPNGIWDAAHNMPIFRKGTTATHPNLDWNNRPEFLIDAACFPGSSGSPVFLLNEGGYMSRKGGIFGGNRLKLLGVLYAGPQHTVEGDIKIVAVPTQNKPISVASIPNNLGMIIKSRELLVFDELLANLRKKKEPPAPSEAAPSDGQ